MMIIQLILLIYYLYKVRGAKLEVYEEDADSLFQTILGDVYTIKNIYPMPNITIDAKINKTKILTKHEEKSNFQVSNMTKEDYVIQNLKELLQYNETAKPDFDEDEIELVTRRFDEMITRRVRFVPKDVVGRDDKLLQSVNRTVAIMEQYIYLTRDRLPYAQLLRKKYNNQIRYKVGYCLALLRNLKQQQMVLYNSYVKLSYRTHFLIKNYMFNLLIYEKVLRLDVDIKDVIKLVKKLEKQRKEEEEPKDDLIPEAENNSLNYMKLLEQNILSPAGRTGFIDPRSLKVKNLMNRWRRVNSRDQHQVTLRHRYRKVINPYFNSKRSHNKSQNRSQLWSSSNKINRTGNDHNLYF